MPKGVRKVSTQQSANKGDVFSSWEVLGKDENKRRYYFCKCVCGSIRSVRIDSLLTGDSTSCGCVSAQSAAIRAKEIFTTHGLSKSKVRAAWKDMIRRCYKETCISYPNYGAIGITVCDRWLGKKGFLNFLEDMGHPPENGTLERISVNENYTPDNCKWETSLSVQGFNKRLPKRNRYGKTGVRLTKTGHTWQAFIHKDKKFYNLGTYKTFEEAVAARREGELLHYGFYQQDWEENVEET